MTTSHADSSSSLTPSQQLHTFLNELPSPFREQLLYRLYAFFWDEIFSVSEHSTPKLTLELVVLHPSDYFAFQRAILIIGALDYLFSQKTPWPTLVEDYLAIKMAGMTCGAFNPVRDEPYLEAREKWKKLRSKLSYFLLRKIDEKVSLSYRPDQLAPDP